MSMAGVRYMQEYAGYNSSEYMHSTADTSTQTERLRRRPTAISTCKGHWA